MILRMGKDPEPQKGQCGTCAHFRPDIVYTHKGRPLTAWYGTCALRPDTPCEQSHACPEWAEK